MLLLPVVIPTKTSVCVDTWFFCFIFTFVYFYEIVPNRWNLEQKDFKLFSFHSPSPMSDSGISYCSISTTVSAYHLISTGLKLQRHLGSKCWWTYPPMTSFLWLYAASATRTTSAGYPVFISQTAGSLSLWVAGFPWTPFSPYYHTR